MWSGDAWTVDHFRNHKLVFTCVNGALSQEKGKHWWTEEMNFYQDRQTDRFIYHHLLIDLENSNRHWAMISRLKFICLKKLIFWSQYLLSDTPMVGQFLWVGRISCCGFKIVLKCKILSETWIILFQTSKFCEKLSPRQSTILRLC